MREPRSSERDAFLRKFFRKNLVGQVNNPMDVERFSRRETFYDEEASAREGRSVIYELVRGDPEIPVIDIAKAIKDVVAGEEDRDSARYTKGAQLLLAMDKKYRIWNPMWLSSNSSEDEVRGQAFTFESPSRSHRESQG